ncbi:MAG: ADP-ribosylation factor-like protein [archaeon]|nr:ADP-ribosylation factor-like protein [archaeon]
MCGLWSSFFSVPQYTVVILGLDGAGKTSFLQATKPIFSGMPALAPDHIAPTIGLNVSTIDAKGIRLLLQDLGGQVSLRPLWDRYLPESDAVVFVLSAASDTFRMEEAKQCIAHILQVALPSVPFLLIANKQDLPSHAPLPELQQFLKQLGIEGRAATVLPVNSLSGEGVKEAVEWLMETIVERKIS